MNSLEQYLKPPTNNKEEEIYNEDGEKGGDENEYIENQENGNDNGENNEEYQDEQEDNIQDSNNIKIQNNEQYEDENNDIIQGINSLNNLTNKNINININKEDNQFENEENNINFDNEKNKIDYENNNFLNINENTNNETNSPDDLMNELLFKIHKIKENRAKKNNNISNDINNLNNLSNTNNIDNIIPKKTTNKNEYIGKLNVNNQVFQNNPKMKELANLLKEYSRDKNVNDKIQINFYNNNQINIIKPEVFFNNNNSKNKNIDYYGKNYENKHYISVIDGKAIIKGQRISVNNGIQKTQNYLMNKNDYNYFNKYKDNLFCFNNDKFNDKRDKYNNNNISSKMWETGNNLDYKLNNCNENSFKSNIEKNNKIEFKKFNKNYFTKDFYNEEINKINDSLFNNKDNYLNQLKK